MKYKKVDHAFVEFIPEKIDEGILYISDEHCIAVHLCCCGCREKVVTPLSPVDWQYKLSLGGISLSPSIGNWDYACRSHYIIRDSCVVWANSMSDAQIQRVKRKDFLDKQAYIAKRNASEKGFFTLFLNYMKGLFHR